CPALRAVLELHLEHGFGAADIARLLERKAGTVRSQISRGMELLRRTLPPGLLGAGIGSSIAAPAQAQAQALAGIRRAVLARASEAGLSTAASISAASVSAASVTAASVSTASTTAAFTLMN